MSESADSAKSGRKLKEGVKLKTKPAVVPKYRKIKAGGPKLPMAAMMPKGITAWNIVFSTLFLGLLVATIVNFSFIEFLSVPLPDLFIKYIVPVALILEVFLVLIAFEAKAISFPKIHTRHSVKRIMIVGFIIGSLLVSFFTPYFNLIGCSCVPAPWPRPMRPRTAPRASLRSFSTSVLRLRSAVSCSLL